MIAPDTLPGQPRSVAAQLVFRVADNGDSLGDILARHLDQLDDPRQRAFAQALCFGTLRWYHRLEAVAGQLLRKPLRRKDRDVHALLMVGLYQLLILESPAHAAVSETVQAVRVLGKHWAAGMVNGTLRNAQRNARQLLEHADRSEQARWSHPQWWIDALRRDWKEHWSSILEANNQRAPMTLRVNALMTDREAYLRQLDQAGLAAHAQPFVASAIALDQPVPVEALPGFGDGLVSVQDGAAQLCAFLLDLKPGQRVLDACAAPGGKTGHILELEPSIDVLYAVDRDERRLKRVRENLQRLRLGAELIAADAGDPQSWWDGLAFHRILLDAPCSASGVVRRHPDIKLLRREGDLLSLAAQQQRLLEALWPLLAPGGMLLYSTCSVFRSENGDALQAFLQRHPDAAELPIDADWGLPQVVGRQVLPGEAGMDGFYFARILKT